MEWLGLDIGGANLKLADGLGFAASRYYPLWRRPQGLAAAIGELLSEAPTASGLAVTMTGELADCFVTKREGVARILDAVEAAAGHSTVRVYLTNGGLVAADVARANPLQAAAANWHALASFAGRFASAGAALLVDVGSTTTDLIPLCDGRPATKGLSDPERLTSGELIYTGVQRSPICALISSVIWRGETCPLAQEVFATTWDAYLALDDLPQQPGKANTADGRAATKSAARDRLARSICADRELFDEQDAYAMARSVEQAQFALLARAARAILARSPAPPETAIVSGSGEFLARRLARSLTSVTNVISLSERIGVEASRCAPAHALAVLARESSQ